MRSTAISREARLENEPHALYRLFDDQRRLLYIGISVDFGDRAHRHLKKSWGKDIAYMAIEHFSTRSDVLAAERRAIVAEQPMHNLAHSGQASDPYLGQPSAVVRFEQIPFNQFKASLYQQVAVGDEFVIPNQVADAWAAALECSINDLGDWLEHLMHRGELQCFGTTDDPEPLAKLRRIA